MKPLTQIAAVLAVVAIGVMAWTLSGGDEQQSPLAGGRLAVRGAPASAVPTPALPDPATGSAETIGLDSDGAHSREAQALVLDVLWSCVSEPVDPPHEIRLHGVNGEDMAIARIGSAEELLSLPASVTVSRWDVTCIGHVVASGTLETDAGGERPIIDLRNCHPVSGVVRDEFGNGIYGTDVELSLSGESGTSGTGVLSTTSDRNGRFCFAAIPPDRTYRLSASAQGWDERVVPLVLPGDDLVVDLVPVLTFDGLVIGPDGTATPGASVAVAGSAHPPVLTDTSGRFSARCPVSPSVRLTAVKAGIGWGWLDVEGSDPLSGLKIMLDPPARISGTARWPDGSPGSGVMIHVNRVGADGRLTSETPVFQTVAVTSSTGEFSLEVPEGWMHLRPMRPAGTGVVAHSGQHVELPLPRPVRLTLRLQLVDRVSRQAVPGLGTEWRIGPGDGSEAWSHSGSAARDPMQDGVVVIDAEVPPDRTLALTLTVPGYESHVLEISSSGPRVERRVLLEPDPVVKVEVVDVQSEPLPETKVEVFWPLTEIETAFATSLPTKQLFDGRPSGYAWGRSDERGQFTFRAPSGRPVRALVTRNGFEPRVIELSPPGAGTVERRVTMHRAQGTEDE